MFYKRRILFIELSRFIKDYRVFAFITLFHVETIIFPQYLQLIEYCKPYIRLFYEEKRVKFITTSELAVFALRYCFLILENVICYICMSVYCLYIYIGICNRTYR